MIKYKQENFLQFIWVTKTPFMLGWGMNFGMLVLIVIYLIVNMQNFTEFDLFMPFFLLIGMTVMKVIIYSLNFASYSSGGNAIKELSSNQLIILENIDVFFKGSFTHDMNDFSVFSDSPCYSFHKADLAITDGSIILMGKGFEIGILFIAKPFEIVFNKGFTNLPKVKAIKWVDLGTQFEIEFLDKRQKKNIKIYIKTPSEKVKQWLTAPTRNQEIIASLTLINNR